MERPEFNEIQDYDEFCKYYWYREELIKICKELGLKANGSKIELNDVINPKVVKCVLKSALLI